MSSSLPENIHPITGSIVSPEEKASRLKQAPKVIWLYGLSGSGKSTLANALERKLLAEGFTTHLLDGDNIRTGLNRNLGFSDEDRQENIRRIAEVSKLFTEAGLICINSFITPTNELRRLARSILQPEQLIEVYIKCSFETCQKRDVKGLYAKAASGNIKSFTGKDSSFEEPENPDLILDTDTENFEKSLEKLYLYIKPHVQSSAPESP